MKSVIKVAALLALMSSNAGAEETINATLQAAPAATPMPTTCGQTASKSA